MLPLVHMTSIRKTWFLALLVVLVGMLCFLVFWSPSPPKTHYMEIRDDAFVPSSMTVQAGDTVVFRNAGNRAVWPASDPHPTHEYLDGLDVTGPLPPGTEWSFLFAKTGTWNVHDHLSPSVRATVTVHGQNLRAFFSAQIKGGPCDGACFDERIRELVEEDGIDAAYAFFQDTYESGSLPRSCHWTAHRIGEVAYELFQKGEEVPISHATTFCGFGFYHGFLEGLLRDNPDPAYALSFCEQVEKEIGTLGLQNCYHGIGHGYTEDPPDPRTEGSFEKMIEPGIRMCEYLFGKDFTYLNLCLTGVFTVPAGFADKDEYGLSMSTSDPFAYCEGQPTRYLKACYGEFAPKLDHRLEWDIARLPATVTRIDDARLKRLVTWVVPSVFMAHDILKEDFDSYINGCRDGFSETYARICWGGSILGFYSHGEPEKQYKKGLVFCSSNAWHTQNERTFCYGEVLRQARHTYGVEKMQEVCKDVPDAFARLCLDEKGEHVSPYDDPSFE